MTFTKYTTIQGDRWDTIAHKAYGDPLKISPIVEANPHVPKTPILPAGVVLYVPIQEREDVSPNNLPPWKR